MSRHFNGLTPAEAERLAFLAEEMGEALQIIGKTLRHGYESCDPRISPSPTNRELLAKELGDVLGAIDALVGAADVSEDALLSRRAKRGEWIADGVYMHHNGKASR